MKPYVKPELYYESFELAQHIAGCSLKWNKFDAGQSCSASGLIGDTTSENWFISNVQACTVETEDYCYTQGNIHTATINS